MDAQLLQNHWIVSSGERHGGARISGVGRTPQHEASRGEIAARNQFIRSLERRGDFIGIEAVDRNLPAIMGSGTGAGGRAATGAAAGGAAATGAERPAVLRPAV